jgi:hypothetical protein
MYLKFDQFVVLNNSIVFCAYSVACFLILGSLIMSSSSQPIYSQSCISDDTTDKDGDDIPDKWEVKGVDVNHDGKIDMNLSAKNASSLHKDIFLEIDYMKWHQPYAQVIPDVIKAFSNAPVCNPDGTTGIKLHVQLDEEIPHKDKIKLWDDFDGLYAKYFGTLSERRYPNHKEVLAAKGDIYHYAIFGHTYDLTKTPEDESWSSGRADQPGMDLLVSLGAFTDPTHPGHTVGTVAEQEAALMHELGHNLGLGHGGNDEINCKPNYLSVMNYAFEFPIPVSDRPLDYSRSSLATLNEASLNEASGISQSIPPGLNSIYGPGEYRFTKTGTPVNWNRGPDSNLNDTSVKADITYLKNYEDCEKKNPSEVLNGFDDWSHLVYDSAKHKKPNNAVANIVTKLPSISSAPESNFSFPIIVHNATTIHYHNQSKIIREMTFNDIKSLNLQLASSLNNAIGNLSDESFQHDSNRSNSFLSYHNESYGAELAKSFYVYKIGNASTLKNESPEKTGDGNNRTIIENLKSGKIDNAISSLNSLLPTMDYSIGGNQSNDKIVNSSAQLHIADQIKDAIKILKAQSCRYSNCTIVDKAPNQTIEY